MNSKKSRVFLTGKPLAYLLALVYFTSYMTRKNFATVLQQVVTDTGLAKDTLSVILVAMTVTYGVGQIVSGRLSDKFKPANMILYGLGLATVINLLFPLLPFSVPLMAILWGINGFAHALVWPPMIKILVANCDDAMYGYSVVRVYWGCSIATILLYLVAPLTISAGAGWKGIFFVSSAMGIGMILLWVVLKRRIFEGTSEKPVSTVEPVKTKKKGAMLPRAAVLPFLLIAMGVILHGMLRDGVATWMPTYLAENHGMSNEVSIFSGVFPAIFSIVCFTVGGALYGKVFKNEVVCATAIFGLATASALILFLLYGKSNATVATVCLTAITGCMHGVNLMLVTHIPKRFKKSGNVSTMAGIVNACTYVGEAIFTYGFSMLATHFSWRICLFACLAIAALGMFCCLFATRPWKKFIEQE